MKINVKICEVRPGDIWQRTPHDQSFGIVISNEEEPRLQWGWCKCRKITILGEEKTPKILPKDNTATVIRQIL